MGMCTHAQTHVYMYVVHITKQMASAPNEGRALQSFLLGKKKRGKVENNWRAAEEQAV